MGKMFSGLKDFALKNSELWQALDGFVINNPVFVQGLALTPIVVAASTLENAMILVVTLAILYIPTTVIARVFGKFFPLHLRDFVIVLLTSLLYVPAYFTASQINENLSQTIGIYLPLLVVDTLILNRASKVSKSEDTVSRVIIQSVLTIWGFAVAALFLGALRELLSYGTLLGTVVFESFSMPIMSKAFMGFILVGLLAAWNQYFGTRFKRAVGLKQKEEQDERAY